MASTDAARRAKVGPSAATWPKSRPGGRSALAIAHRVAIAARIAACLEGERTIEQGRGTYPHDPAGRFVFDACRVLNGIVWILPEADFPFRPLEPWLSTVGGNSVLRCCPSLWKRDKGVFANRIWGKPGGDRELMKHLKRTLDPGDVFNPGRLFGDL